MAIKNDPQNPGTFKVSYSRRHPITKESRSLIRKGFKTKAEARRALNQMVLDLESKFKRAVVPTWDKMVNEYHDASLSRGLMNKTVYDNDVCLKAHTFGAWKTRLVDSITTLEIRSLLEEKVGQRAPSHQRYVLKAIRSVFQYAFEAGHIQRNPTPLLKFKVGDKIQKVLSEEQARILLQRAEEQNWKWYPHYVVALYTGMRSGELYALTWDKVDFERGIILVNCSWSSKDGYKSTKSGDDRIVEIAPPLKPLLRQFQNLADGSPYVLPHLYEWQKGEQARALATFLEANGLPGMRFHDLRATWATMLLSKGVEPIKVMKMGGWKDLDTMMIYARKAGVDIRGALDCIDLGSGNVANVLQLTAKS